MIPIEDDPIENKRLQVLVKELTYQISLLLSENEQIRRILEGIEKEGFQVDLVVASLSRILSADEDLETGSEEAYELNPFDYAFLQAIKVKP